MKKHHKIILGSFGTMVLIFMIISGILINGLIVKQTLNHKETLAKIDELQLDTQTKLNQLTESLMGTQQELNSLNNDLGSINQEFSLLKASASSDFSGIIENSIKSVITIKTDVAQGTGFLITNNGYIVTNTHILSGAKKLYCLNYKQERLATDLIGYNLDFDIALLKVNGTFDKFEFDDSETVQLGEKVIAIGNPLGLQFSVTEGIVSGIHRPGLNGEPAYIQTDAALNPGNSGGPLINKEGKIIGINNFKLGTGENLGFALESNYIKEVVNTISEKLLNQTLIY